MSRTGTAGRSETCSTATGATNVPEPNAVPVEAALADGTTARGKVLVPMGKGLADVLNGVGGFVEFEPYGGERGFLAKAQLARVTPVGVPKPPNLGARLSDAGGFDPHVVLGLTAGASREELRGLFPARQGLSPRPLRHRRAARGGARLLRRHGAPHQCRLCRPRGAVEKAGGTGRARLYVARPLRPPLDALGAPPANAGHWAREVCRARHFFLIKPSRGLDTQSCRSVAAPA